MTFDRNSQHAFTFLELLIVVAVILILLALVTLGAGIAGKKRKTLEAVTTTEAIAIALQQLKTDYQYDDIFAKGPNGGRLEEFCDTNEIVRELLPGQADWSAEYKPRMNVKKTAYLQLKLHTVKDGVLIDPWAQPYKYFVYAVEVNQWPYEVEAIYSSGPDRIPFNSDDVVRKVAEYPVPAQRTDATRPARDLKAMQDNLGWPKRPEGWR